MKRAGSLLALFVLLAGAAALGQEKNKQILPQLVVNARFVYVTTYDGPPWLPRVLPEDRQAVSDVEDAFMKWGRYTLVYEPQHADLIVVVQSRGSEDTFAVYDAKSFGSIPLWRTFREGGLDSPEMPLFTEFQSAVESAAVKKR